MIEQSNLQRKKNNFSFKLAAINVNSIAANQRRNLLLNFLNVENPDIVCLAETKLKSHHNVKFANYDIIRDDRDSVYGGGTAILIRRNIKYKRVQIVSNTTEQILETTIIKIEIRNDANLFIIAAYAKCGAQKEFIPNLENIFQKLKLNIDEAYYILAGDLNAKHTDWSNPNNNARGISLKKWITENEIKNKAKLYSTVLPSYPYGGSFLDVIIADARLDFKNVIDYTKIPNVSYDSDHNALVTEISLLTDEVFKLEDTENIITFNYREANWEKFKDELKKKLKSDIPNDRNLSMEEILKNLNDINSAIWSTMVETIPGIVHKNSMESYVNEKIKKLTKHKKKILTQLHRQQKSWPNVNDEAVIILRRLLADVRAALKVEYKLSINKYWHNKISKISYKDSATMFPQVNQIFRKKGLADIQSLKIPIESTQMLKDYNISTDSLNLDDKNNYIVSSTDKKLDIIGAFFANVNNTDKEENPRFSQLINSKVKDILKPGNDEDRPAPLVQFSTELKSDTPHGNDQLRAYFTNTLTLEQKFRKLNNKKSAGLDNIPNAVLRKLPLELIRIFAILFNNLLNMRVFPNIWKKAKVIAIQKKNKEGSNPLNYRPISLLPNIGKVYEMVINDAILKICIEKEVIPENQFGFRKNHSTVHAINKLVSDVCWALNDNKCVGACLIDLEKAFDSVWHEGLIFKLTKKGFPTHLTELIHSMITERSFITTLGRNTSSLEFKIKNGLQQGTVNSPILFNIYTSDVLKLFSSNTEHETNTIAFADDLILYYAHKWPSVIQNKLQDVFDRITLYYKSWKLKINANKCETILFRPDLAGANRNIRKHYKTFHLKENKNSELKIPHRNVVKYLGVYVDDRLKYNIHVENQLVKARKAFQIHKRLFYSKALISKIKIICYLLLIRPILTYGCPIWWNISASQAEKIRIFERKCLRSCLSMFRDPNSDYIKHYSNKMLYDKANVSRIDSFVIKLIRDHFVKVRYIPHNSLISGILYPNQNYFEHTLNTGYIPPEAFIYLDQEDLILDRNNIPLIYHVPRHKNIKKILYSSKINCVNDKNKIKYCISMPEKDKKSMHDKDLKKYWWIGCPPDPKA